VTGIKQFMLAVPSQKSSRNKRAQWLNWLSAQECKREGTGQLLGQGILGWGDSSGARLIGKRMKTARTECSALWDEKAVVTRYSVGIRCSGTELWGGELIIGPGATPCMGIWTGGVVENVRIGEARIWGLRVRRGGTGQGYCGEVRFKMSGQRQCTALEPI